MNVRDYKTAKERREALGKVISVTFEHVGTFSLDEAVASTRNCENMIGVAQVPMGIAGPLAIRSINDERPTMSEYYIPLATTEGALVASVSRGCKAITESGGAVTDSHRVGATRGPVFRVNNLKEAKKLSTFLETHNDEIAGVAQKTSQHLTLVTYSLARAGKYLFVRFVFDSQDAMGLNMVTIATDAIASYIKKQTGVSCVALSGNFCVDKKPSAMNAINGRGIQVWAEVTIPKNVLQTVLKTTARKAYDVWLSKCMVGSAMSGSMGFNAQYANVVAAMFIATGQDPAHVVEGSLGVTTCQIVGDDLYVSIYVPDLMVGTVGGGTGLATQNEALQLLGVAGPSADGGGKHAKTFAEIVGGAVLAGEISLLSALEEGTLASAHKKLGRGEAA